MKFLEIFLYRLKFKYWDYKYYWAFPNKWAHKAVPRSAYKDKPEIILDVLYASVVDFVENEGCFELIDWNYNEGYKKIGDFITECYDWIKVKRPQLSEKIDKIICNRFVGKDIKDYIKDIGTVPYDEAYPGLKELEKELQEKDDYYLSKIVEYRGYLWV